MRRTINVFVCKLRVYLLRCVFLFLFFLIVLSIEKLTWHINTFFLLLLFCRLLIKWFHSNVKNDRYALALAIAHKQTPIHLFCHVNTWKNKLRKITWTIFCCCYLCLCVCMEIKRLINLFSFVFSSSVYFNSWNIDLFLFLSHDVQPIDLN